MPDSTSLKEFVISVRTRRRYHSQCTPEKSMNAIGMYMYLYFIKHFNFIYFLYILY